MTWSAHLPHRAAYSGAWSRMSAASTHSISLSEEEGKGGVWEVPGQPGNRCTRWQRDRRRVLMGLSQGERAPRVAQAGEGGGFMTWSAHLPHRAAWSGAWSRMSAASTHNLTKGNSNSHGARTVHLIITMIKRIRTSRLSMKHSR